MHENLESHKIVKKDVFCNRHPSKLSGFQSQLIKNVQSRQNSFKLNFSTF